MYVQSTKSNDEKYVQGSNFICIFKSYFPGLTCWGSNLHEHYHPQPHSISVKYFETSWCWSTNHFKYMDTWRMGGKDFSQERGWGGTFQHMSVGRRNHGWNRLKGGWGRQRLDHAGPYRLILLFKVLAGNTTCWDSLRFNSKIFITGMLIGSISGVSTEKAVTGDFCHPRRWRRKRSTWGWWELELWKWGHPYLLAEKKGGDSEAARNTHLQTPPLSSSPAIT